LIVTRAAGSILLLSLSLTGCDSVARDAIHIALRPQAVTSGVVFDLEPTQSAVEDAIEAVSTARDLHCRRNVRRLEEWTCRGPNEMHITCRPDGQHDRMVIEFTLVLRGPATRTSFDGEVAAFTRFMQQRFGDSVQHI
jgi:hypothetical protein